MADLFDVQTWDPETETPYVHWRRSMAQTARLKEQDIAYRTDRSIAAFSEVYTAKKVTPEEVRSALRPLGGGSGADMPMPAAVANPKGHEVKSLVPANLHERMVQKLPKDAVITAIVDEGIALGNPRFRDATGRSRVLAAWQQGASFASEQGDYLPFGNEIYQAEIDKLLGDHSLGGDLRAPLDDARFNRAARICEPLARHGECSTARHATHGTSALDLAAGFDAWAVDADHLARRPLITVSLPHRKSIGMAGTYLEFFAIHAVMRIVAMADALWKVWYGDEGGFPIVLNMSYGQQSGPKDGNSPFERQIWKLQQGRPAQAPLEVVMPVGNDNLMRCHARRNLKVKTSNEMWENWRIQPDDQSSNFAEIWSAARRQPKERHTLRIKVTSPFGEEMSPWRGRHGQYQEIGGGGRIYCQRIAYVADKTTYRYRYVICVPPTAGEGAGPAGIWKLRVNDPRKKGEVYMQVQVDQSPEPGSMVSRRSYFDNPRYKTHLPNGRLRDSYAYPLIDPKNPGTSNQENFSVAGHVQRKGTINSIAVLPSIVSVGSFRESDGRPCDFSATSYWGKRAPAKVDPRMTLAMPGDASAMRLGLRAAGTRAGSSLRVRGTSFSTALATRRIVDAMIAGTKMPDGAADWLRHQAARSEARMDPAHESKRGHGRLTVARSNRF